MRFSCYLSVILRNYRLNFARSTPTLYSVAATRTRFNLSKGMYNLQRAAKATPANPIKLWSGWFCGSWLAWQLQWCACVCTGMQFDSSLLLFICVCCVQWAWPVSIDWIWSEKKGILIFYFAFGLKCSTRKQRFCPNFCRSFFAIHDNNDDHHHHQKVCTFLIIIIANNALLFRIKRNLFLKYFYGSV